MIKLCLKSNFNLWLLNKWNFFEGVEKFLSSRLVNKNIILTATRCWLIPPFALTRIYPFWPLGTLPPSKKCNTSYKILPIKTLYILKYRYHYCLERNRLCKRGDFLRRLPSPVPTQFDWWAQGFQAEAVTNGSPHRSWGSGLSSPWTYRNLNFITVSSQNKKILFWLLKDACGCKQKSNAILF